MISLRLALAGLVVMAAGGAPELPVPPVPPPNPPSDTAPVPDDDAQGPRALTADDAQFRLRLYRMQRYDASQGFIPGSRYESSEDKKAIQTPGLSLSVPLH